jgi:hypothetical protein
MKKFKTTERASKFISSLKTRAAAIGTRLKRIKLREIRARHLMPFAPALMCAFLGVAIFFAPTQVISFIAAFLLFLGGFMAYLAWRFVLLFRKLRKLTSEFEARLYIQNVGMRDSADGTMERAMTAQELKKIVYH